VSLQRRTVHGGATTDVRGRLGVRERLAALTSAADALPPSGNSLCRCSRGSGGGLGARNVSTGDFGRPGPIDGSFGRRVCYLHWLPTRRKRRVIHTGQLFEGVDVKRLIVCLVAVGALAASAGWIPAAGAAPGPDPDANGDVHSNCHTGSKFRGAGGEDRFKLHGNGEVGDCFAAPVPVNPVTPAAPPAAPAAAAAPSAGAGAAAVRAPAVTSAAAAAPVVAAPRTTG
jgi:hypothetical protein